MFYGCTSLVVVGADYPTSRAPGRRAAIVQSIPGDRLELRRERGSRGKRLIGVYSDRGEQLGYILPEQASLFAGQVTAARAVFEGAAPFGAAIRATFDGSAPTLPISTRLPRTARQTIPELEDEFCEITIQPMTKRQ